MENHPIPQDVTGFQFKLFGNMTVKQFAYLAAGGVFAWVIYSLPIIFLIKFPLSAFSALFGAALAFFPVSGRPMDLMIGNYIKALIRPTQFVYDKIGGQIYFPNNAPLARKNLTHYKNDFNPLPKDKLKIYLDSLKDKPKNKLDEKEDNLLLSIANLSSQTPQTKADITGSQTPELMLQQISYSDLTKNQPAQTQNPEPEKGLDQPETKESQPAQAPVKIPTLPTKKAQEEVAQREPIAAPDIKSSPRIISKPIAPEFPNLITGVARDPRGNALSNILVEVKDKEGNPVRAFKTNELGRFASATPLNNGTYTVEFEDPRSQNKFDVTTINVTGQIIMPIEAVSVDAREELRRTLFASNSKT